MVYKFGYLVHSFIDMRVYYEGNTKMSNFLSLLMLAILVCVICHPIQRRQTENCTVITNVCTVLWHIQDTMKHYTMIEAGWLDSRAA